MAGRDVTSKTTLPLSLVALDEVLSLSGLPLGEAGCHVRTRPQAGARLVRSHREAAAGHASTPAGTPAHPSPLPAHRRRAG